MMDGACPSRALRDDGTETEGGLVLCLHARRFSLFLSDVDIPLHKSTQASLAGSLILLHTKTSRQ
jgi:hypothetical protein